MHQNPQTSSAVPPPGQISSNPSRTGGLSDIESGNPISGNPQQGMPYFAGNPSQVVPREAPKSGCNGPCCMPLQTACLVIGILVFIVELIHVLLLAVNSDKSYNGKYLPPFLLLALGFITTVENLYSVFYVLSVPILIVNVLLVVGSMMKTPLLVLIYVIVTGVYVPIWLIVICTSKLLRLNAEIYHYLYMLLWIYFLLVAVFYYKELKKGQTQRQGQVHMPQAQGQVLGTPGPSQISWSPSQANGQSGQVIGSTDQGQGVGLPGQGQQYGQSY